MLDTMENLQAEMKGHDLFFRQIISMIPRDLYKPEEEEDEEVLNKRYHKHRKLPLATDEKKSISKKKIKEKYEQAVAETVTITTEVPPSMDEFSLPDGEDGLNSLRKRLQERIQHLKQNRKADGNSDKVPHQDRKARRAEERKKNATKFGAKKTNSTSKSITSDDNGGEDFSSGNAGEGLAREVSEGVLRDMINDDASGSSVKKARVLGDGDVGDIMYSGLVDSSSNVPKAGNPGSKTRRLERMIEEADKKRRRQEELKSMGDEGKQRVLAEQWSDVIQEAAGKKVLINTTKIKKVLKRREKSKEKSAKEWKERLHDVESAKNKRQEKREENILKRKRGSDYIEPSAAGDATGAVKKSSGTPIGGLAATNKKSRGNEGIGDGSKLGKGGGGRRAGFEGKKTEFLNKKK